MGFHTCNTINIGERGAVFTIFKMKLYPYAIVCNNGYDPKYEYNYSRGPQTIVPSYMLFMRYYG